MQGKIATTDILVDAWLLEIYTTIYKNREIETQKNHESKKIITNLRIFHSSHVRSYTDLNTQGL